MLAGVQTTEFHNETLYLPTRLRLRCKLKHQREIRRVGCHLSMLTIHPQYINSPDLTNTRLPNFRSWKRHGERLDLKTDHYESRPFATSFVPMSPPRARATEVQPKV